MTLRHITAAEVRNQQKRREREIKRKREREGKETQSKERGDRKIFHDWIRHCNFTSFLTLLINKSNRKKLKKAKLKKSFELLNKK